MSTDHARILIIDDDGVLLTALADTLKIRLGHIVIDTANTGADGLAQAESNRYNIILCDISMPDLQWACSAAPAEEDHPRLGNHYDDCRWRGIDPKNGRMPRRLALIHKPFDGPARTLKQVLQAQTTK
jgi:hypothetical protein